MTAEAGGLNRATAGFGIAAAVVILFNTVLACVKDANPALLKFMNSIAGHNWTTQGLADLVLFFGLGAVAMKAPWSKDVAAGRVIGWVAVSTVVAVVGLAVWYALF